MNPIPRLTDAELVALRESIRQDGMRYPVLLDRAGNVIDGHHRKQICAELGLECRTETLDVDAETAERLGVTLNLARRQLSTDQRMDLIAWLAERHEADAKAAALDRKAKGGMGGNEVSLSKRLSSDKSGKATADIADHINADLAELGQPMTVSRSTVERAQRWAKVSEADKTAVRNGKKSATDVLQPGKKSAARKQPVGREPDPRRAELLASQARIRAIDDDAQYRSMLNAPRGKLNLPMLRRAEQIQPLLDDLFELDPEDAAASVPPERLSEFSTSRAEWWGRFTDACEKRWHEEVPDLPARRPVRSIPLKERDLTRAARLALDWLRTQADPVTATSAAVAMHVGIDHARRHLGALVVAEMAEVVGTIDGRDAFVAVER